MTKNKLRSRSDSVVQLEDRERSNYQVVLSGARRGPWQGTTGRKQASSFTASPEDVKE